MYVESGDSLTDLIINCEEHNIMFLRYIVGCIFQIWIVKTSKIRL